MIIENGHKDINHRKRYYKLVFVKKTLWFFSLFFLNHEKKIWNNFDNDKAKKFVTRTILETYLFSAARF